MSVPSPRTVAFTSINLNYLAKARILGRSLRQHHPEIDLHLMLCDAIPEWLDVEDEPFESILTIADLGIEGWRAWAFGHSVVELCTAVKPFAFRHLLDRTEPDRLLYLDPDLVFFSRCDPLFRRLDGASVVLTPHVAEPNATVAGVVDNEISCLAHGIYNLGFLGIRGDEAGRRIVDWWADRLGRFCHDDIPRGLFVDQRWMDFVPALFEDCAIVRDPEYNVATWNYSTRSLSGSMAKGILVDGRPLGFHHFSGVDNGASAVMLARYAADVPVARELDEWYRRECLARGQAELGRLPWHFGRYENGDPIDRRERLLYRNHADLREAFPDPFAVGRGDGGGGAASFHEWLRSPANANRVSLGPEPRPPLREFVVRTLRTLREYVRESYRLAGWQKNTLLAALEAVTAVGRAVGRLVRIR